MDQDSNEGIAWEVPEKSDFMRTFGPLEKSGKLLKAEATVHGKTAYKRFVVSERSTEERAKNPVLDEMTVIVKGKPVPADENGVYETNTDKVTFSPAFDEDTSDFYFEWYSTIADFQPESKAELVFDPDGRGLWTIYCIVRKEFTFYHSESVMTSYTGSAWWRGEIRFQN